VTTQCSPIVEASIAKFALIFVHNNNKKMKLKKQRKKKQRKNRTELNFIFEREREERVETIKGVGDKHSSSLRSKKFIKNKRKKNIKSET
jgi:ADP-dependent phosphofructokinase/glucokinase